MCGRFTLKTPATELASLFDGLDFSGIRPRYNICPTQAVTCVRQNQQRVAESASLRWGLVPFWAKDLKIGARMINARSETVATKPAFRAAFKKRRCLVIADGFYEWKKQGAAKQPYYISRQDETPYAMAGLWESWSDKANPDSEPVETCTILTTAANATMAPLHDRMPVLLEPDDYPIWLDAEFKDADKLDSLMQPSPEGWLQHWPVSTFVNRPGNDSPACIAPVEM